ncbi:MAG: MarR family transcriptional regulator, partial [Deltaproteobacteria bacterium]|nr:MarR family transcriptional regulator [Deltaproteobacteria bacterium]
EYIGFLISRTHKILKKKLTTLVQDYDLTVRQYGVLRRLYEEDGLPARELVVRLYSDSSTIIDIIDRLEEKGLVRREADPHDRRVNRIYLTDKARVILPKILSRVDRFERAIYRHLSPQETKAIKTGLNKLHKLAVAKGTADQANSKKVRK